MFVYKYQIVLFLYPTFWDTQEHCLNFHLPKAFTKTSKICYLKDNDKHMNLWSGEMLIPLAKICPPAATLTLEPS